MRRTFLKLRSALYENGLMLKDIAKKLYVTAAAVDQRFSGKTEWRLSEIYIVMDMINRPYEEIPIYFPRDINKQKGE